MAEERTISLISRITYSALKVFNAKDRVFNSLLKNPGRGKNAVSVKTINKNLFVNETYIDGFSLLTINTLDPTNKHIILLHGGAYVAEATRGHRKLIEKLVGKYNFKVSFIDYPLAPEHNAVFSHRIVRAALLKLSEENTGDEFYLLGDSAGGGLALAILQSMRNNKDAIILRKTFLLSPWLDISMKNPEIKDFINKDVLLQVNGLKECGKLYAGDLKPEDPLVSPINGNLENLGELIVFVSTHEIFYPDCRLLKSKIESLKGTSIKLSVKEKMLHDWIVFPGKESDETIDEIARNI